MSSQRYSTTQSFHEEVRRGTDGHNIPYERYDRVPIQHSTTVVNEPRIPSHVRLHDTKLNWITDPVTGHQKFRVTINIEGFRQHEVGMRIEGRKLIVFGEHVEKKDQSSTKKTIEKSFELPSDIDIHSHRLTFPAPTTMQIDFSSQHSNVIIDDGRHSSNFTTNYDVSYRAPTRRSEERTTNEFITTRKLGGGDYERPLYNPPSSSSTYERKSETVNTTRDSYTSTHNYQTSGHHSPARQDFIESRRTDPSIDLNAMTHKFQTTIGNTLPRPTYSVGFGGDNDNAGERVFTESHHEVHRRRSSPKSGTQSSHEVEHHRSGSPPTMRNVDSDRLRTTVAMDRRAKTPPYTSRNVEVREYSRRLGGDRNYNNAIYDADRKNNPPTLFTPNFNSDAFYRSSFRPQIITDNRGQSHIEMKLDVRNYEPTDIKVSVNGHDLVVQAERSITQPPSASSRASFYKQVTLPPNTDIPSLSSQYIQNSGILEVKAKLLN